MPSTQFIAACQLDRHYRNVDLSRSCIDHCVFLALQAGRSAHDGTDGFHDRKCNTDVLTRMDHWKYWVAKESALRTCRYAPDNGLFSPGSFRQQQDIGMIVPFMGAARSVHDAG